MELVCSDDQTNPNLVADLYHRLLDVEKVDLVIRGYGDNSAAPAMPLIVERKPFFIGLMALAVNARFSPEAFDNLRARMRATPRATLGRDLGEHKDQSQGLRHEWDPALESGGVLVGNEITITLDAEFVKS